MTIQKISRKTKQTERIYKLEEQLKLLIIATSNSFSKETQDLVKITSLL